MNGSENRGAVGRAEHDGVRAVLAGRRFRYGSAALLVVLAFLPALARAQYANLIPPSIWSATSAAGGAGVVGAATVVGGGISTSGLLGVGGQAVSIPARINFAANAPQFARVALRFSPQRFLATAAMGWALDGGLEWVIDQWRKKEAPSGQNANFWFVSGQPACGTVSAPTCTFEQAANLTCSTAGVAGAFFAGRIRFPDTGPGTNATVYCKRYVGSPDGDDFSMTATRSTTPQPETDRAANDADWNALNTLPDAVAQEVMKQGFPLPVEEPAVTPYRIPLGVPEPVPGADPAKWAQPVVDVVGAPSPATPWRVNQKPGTVESPTPTPPVPVPMPIPSPDSNPALPGAPGAPGAPAPAQITCGLPGTPPCKIDEAGTTDGKELVTAFGVGTSEAWAERLAKLGERTAVSTWIGPVFTLPTLSVSCGPIDFGKVGSLDFCPALDISRIGFQWFWGLVMVIFVYRRVGDAVSMGV